MDSYENTPCTDCGSYKLIQLSSDITCSNCGLEQGYGNFVYNFFEYNPQTYGYDRVMPEPLSLDPAKAKKLKTPKDVFLDFANTVPVADNIIKESKQMYRDFISERGVNQEDKQYPLVMACIYYTSRAFSPIDRKTLLNSIQQVEENDFSDACKALKLRLGSDRKYRDVLYKINVHDISHQVNQSFSKLSCIPQCNHNAIRSLVHKMHDKLKPTPELATLEPASIVKTLIFMAARAKKLNFQSKSFLDEMSLSKTTVASTEKKLRVALGLH